jgi:hypothetical protein
MRKRYDDRNVPLHAVGSYRKSIDNQLLVLISPPPHVLVRVNDGPDKVNDILSLPALIMEGYAIFWCRQGLKGGSNVDFGSTCDAKMHIGFDESLHKD